MYTTEGLKFIQDVKNGIVPPPAPYYIGLFSGNYTPSLSDVAATFSSLASEAVSYSETTRPQWLPVASIAGESTNTTNKATFTCNANNTHVYGAFLVTSPTKGGTGGKLILAKRFPSMRIYDNLSVIHITIEELLS